METEAAVTEVHVCNVGCEYADIGDAVALSGADRIVVEAGTYMVGFPVWIDRPIEIAGEGASVFSLLDGSPMFDVLPQGAGTSIHGLSVWPSYTGNDPSQIVRIAADDVAIYDLDVSSVQGRSPLVSLTDGSLTLSNSSFDATRLNGGAQLQVTGGSLVVRDTTFTGSEVSGAAELLLATDATVRFERVVVVDSTTSGVVPTQIVTQDTSLSLIDSQLTTTGEGFYPGTSVLVADGGDLSIVGGRWFSDPGMPQAYLTDLDSASLDGLAFDSLEADRVDELALIDVVARSGWVTLTGVDAANVSGSWFCGMMSGSDSTVAMTHSVFQLGGLVLSGSDATVDHTTFRDTTGPSITMVDSDWSVDHSLFVGSSFGPTVSADREPVRFEWNAFSDNVGRLADFGYGASLNRTLEVSFVSEPGKCGQGVTLDDGTDPWVVDNDIGAVPACVDEIPGDGWDSNCDGFEDCPIDTDEDGFGGAFTFPVAGPVGGGISCPVPAGDCDDGDETVYPGARDAWYDGVDADCAGNDDDDRDGDGLGRPVDCDDRDPDVLECNISLGGGCDTGGGRSGWGAVAVLAAWIGRKRAHSAGRATVVAETQARRV